MNADTLRERIENEADICDRNRGQAVDLAFRVARMALREVEARFATIRADNASAIVARVRKSLDETDAPKAEEPGEAPVQDLAAQVKALTKRVAALENWQETVPPRINALNRRLAKLKDV